SLASACPVRVVVEITTRQPSPLSFSLVSNSLTSREAASTSPTLTACTHITRRRSATPATASRNRCGTRPSRSDIPSRYRSVVSIRATHHGELTTSAATSSALYSHIIAHARQQSPRHTPTHFARVAFPRA